MRDDNRRRPPDDEEEDLFRDLRSELETIESRRDENFASDDPGEATPPSLGARPGPAPEGRPAGLGPAAYPPEGFDSDEDLGKLPTMTPGSGHRPRARHVARRRPPLLLLGALCVVLAAAAFLFWPSGRVEAPLGVGERRSEIGADGAAATSGPVTTTDVDIAAQTRQLVPEPGAGRPAAASQAPERAPALREPAARTPPVTGSGPAPEAAASPAESPPPQPAVAGPQPGPEGNWLLQLGAFSTQENSEAFMAQLRAKGLEPRAQTGSSSAGKLVYKVSLGYFRTREDAAEYARREPRLAGAKALPVHR